MEMTLTPLEMFCDDTVSIFLSISEDLLKRANLMLNELEQTALKVILTIQQLSRMNIHQKKYFLENKQK